MPSLKMTDEQIINSLKENFGTELIAADIKGFCAAKNLSYPTVTRRLEKFKTDRGRWNLEITVNDIEKLESTYASTSAPAIASIGQLNQNFIPKKDDSFVKFGNFDDIKKIIKSLSFYPVFITGLSGNGKTFSVEQACAHLGRELIRINITIETDEDDLLGGFRLINGETVWYDGPVIQAMQRGAILLLDEIDLSSNKILCLQSVLEGNGVFLKKIGKYVKPKTGFNVFATANTKGKGSSDGRFIGTNVLNEAFLERFPVTFEQAYPVSSIEQKILEKVLTNLGIEDQDFCNRLVFWANSIRDSFNKGIMDEIISTRRLVHIAHAYGIFKDKSKAIQVCINRFDDETKQSFLEFYDKVDSDFIMPDMPQENGVPTPVDFSNSF